MMSGAGLSEVTTTHAIGESQSTARASRATVRATLERSTVRTPRATPQYSVWPRSRRNWSTEKARMTAKSTQAIAEAAPNWKKFWKAVS